MTMTPHRPPMIPVYRYDAHMPAGTQHLLATMITTTTYGTWLPGDLRGYVEDGVILPGDPQAA